MEFLRKIANLAALIACFSVLIYFTADKVWTFEGVNNSIHVSDSAIFYGAATRLADGKSPYVVGTDVNSIYPGSLYCYPPTLALILAPFTSLSIAGKMLVWYGMITGSFLLLYYLIYRLAAYADITPPKGWGFPVVAGIALLLFEPIQNNYVHAQSNSIVLLLIVAFIYFYLREQKLSAGIMLGLGITLKFFPLIFIPFLFFRREWRVLLITGISAIVILLLPIIYVDLTVIYSDLFEVLKARGSNQYAFCEFFMTLYRSIIWFEPTLAGWFVKLLAIAFLGLALVLADYLLRRRVKIGSDGYNKVTLWMLSIFSTTILLIHPHSEVHICVYAFPAFIFAGLYALKTRCIMQLVIWFIIYGLFFPLLWMQNTPITFVSLLLLNIYCVYIASRATSKHMLDSDSVH